MSEAQKPVEEPVPVVAEAAPVEPVKAEETPAAATEETPAAAEPAATEPAAETPAAPVETPKEFDGSGFLGYKAPGGFIKKLAGFQRKYIWTQEEPIHHKSLSSYLRGEKPEIGNANAAWSSHTGKGLLFFAKHDSDKATPTGVLNLSDVSDVKDDGTLDFQVHAHGQKHVFQATTVADRNAWVTYIKAKIEEAKAAAAGIKDSEEYKKEHSALSKPVLPAPVAAVAPKAEAKAEAKKEEKTEAKEEKKEEKAARKSRSASRKRNSIFGTFGFKDKKEEKAEAAEATPAVAPAAEAAPVDAPTETPAVEAAPAPVAEPAVEEPAKTETPVAAKEETKPVTSKRNSSIFGTLSSKFNSKKEAKTEAAPAVPAKDEVAPAAETPAAAPAVEAAEPVAAPVETAAEAPAEAVSNGVPATTEPEVKPVTKASEKRKSSIPFLGGSKTEKPSAVSDSEGEKPKPSAFSKLRQTIKSKTSSRTPAAEKEKEPAAEATKTEEPAAPAAAEPAVEETPVVSEPKSVVHDAPPTVSATA